MNYVPKFQKVLNQLHREVARGQPGDRLPSVRALMTRFRVSQSAIERSVDELVRLGLVRRVRGSGMYIAGAAAPKSRLLGLYTDSEVAPHSNALFIEGVRATAEAHGFQVADFGPRNLFDNRRSVLASLDELGLAGIVAAFSSASYFQLESDQLLEAFQRLRVPIVTCLPIAALPADAVMPDHVQAFQRLGARLRHRVKGPVRFLGHNGIPSLARLHGLRLGLGPEVRLEVEMVDHFNGTSVYDRVRDLVRDDWEGNLVIGVPPDQAGVIEALRDGPWRRGSAAELSITLEEGELLPPGIVANLIRRPSRRLGATSTELLLRRIRGFRGDPMRIIVPHGLSFHR
ncbi:MAG: GntR family transcriptional regulator [Opitutaceae bacterium]|nr:GntR family transcriptional regulator [Opitutaceae bacterium]